MTSIPVSLTPDVQPRIRVLILDTTGPCARLVVENWPRAAAMALHGIPETKKPRRPAPAGSKFKSVTRL